MPRAPAAAAAATLIASKADAELSLCAGVGAGVRNIGGKVGGVTGMRGWWRSWVPGGGVTGMCGWAAGRNGVGAGGGLCGGVGAGFSFPASFANCSECCFMYNNTVCSCFGVRLRK